MVAICYSAFVVVNWSLYVGWVTVDYYGLDSCYEKIAILVRCFILDVIVSLSLWLITADFLLYVGCYR